MKKEIATFFTASALLLAPTVHADTIYVGGTGEDSKTNKPTDLNWLNHLGPATQVGYPADLLSLGSSVQTGADNLADAVAHSTGPVTIVGGSQGALVLEEYKKRLAADPNARADINFVEFADPSSKYGVFGQNPGFNIPGLNYTTTVPVRTQYATTVISRQYDGAADWPTDQRNLLADLNAIMGFATLHPNYGNIDTTGMTPYDVDGNTTYYKVPTAHLPILQPLRDLGVDQSILNAMEGPLKAYIDSAYNKKPAQHTSTPSKVRPQPVTGMSAPKHHKRSSCARLTVCA